MLLFATLLVLCPASISTTSWPVSLSDLISRLTDAGEFPAASLHLLPCGNVSEQILTGLLRRLPCPRGCTLTSRCGTCREQLISSLYQPPGGALLLWAGSEECLQVPEDRLPSHWAGVAVLLLPPEGVLCHKALAMTLFIKTPFALCASFSGGAWNVWRRVAYTANEMDISRVACSSPSGLTVAIRALAQPPNMRGAKLRVRFLDNYPYVYCTSITSGGACRKFLPRPETNLLRVLAERLNFSVELRQHPRRVWGSRDDSGTWEGLLGSVVHDEADMAIGGTSVTSARAGAVDFLREFALVRSVFVTRRPPPLPVYRTVFAPLSAPLWALIVLSLLLVAGVAALQRQCRYDLALLDVFQIILGQGLCWEATTISGKIFTGTWMLAALVLACVYTSKLTSFLVNGAPGRPVETVEQLIASPYQLAVSPHNKVFLEWLSESEDPAFNILRRKLVIEPDINDTLRMSSEGYQRAHVFEDDFFQYVLSWMITMQNGSLRREDIIVSRDSFMPTALAIPVQKNAPYRRHMDRVILRLTAAGLIQKWLGDKLYVKRRRASRIVACLQDGEQCRGEGERRPISLEHLEAPFGLLLVGYLLATAMFCGELLLFGGTRCGKWGKVLKRRKRAAESSKKEQPEVSTHHLWMLKIKFRRQKQRC